MITLTKSVCGLWREWSGLLCRRSSLSQQPLCFAGIVVSRFRLCGCLYLLLYISPCLPCVPVYWTRPRTPSTRLFSSRSFQRSFSLENIEWIKQFDSLLSQKECKQVFLFCFSSKLLWKLREFNIRTAIIFFQYFPPLFNVRRHSPPNKWSNSWILRTAFATLASSPTLTCG